MTDDPQADQETPSSESPPPAETPEPAASPPEPETRPPDRPRSRRSPVERVLVWGGIVVLLLVAGFQAHGRWGYELSLNALVERIELDEGPNAQPLLVRDVPDYLVGWPSSDVTSHGRNYEVVTYTWPSLAGGYSISLTYDASTAEPAVISLATNVDPNAPEEENAVPAVPEEAGEENADPADPEEE